MTPEQRLIAAGRLRIRDMGPTWREQVNECSEFLDGGDMTLWDRAERQVALLSRFYHVLNGFRELARTESPAVFVVEGKLADIHSELRELDFEKSFAALMCPAIDATETEDIDAVYVFFRKW